MVDEFDRMQDTYYRMAEEAESSGSNGSRYKHGLSPRVVNKETSSDVIARNHRKIYLEKPEYKGLFDKGFTFRGNCKIGSRVLKEILDENGRENVKTRLGKTAYDLEGNLIEEHVAVFEKRK